MSGFAAGALQMLVLKTVSELGDASVISIALSIETPAKRVSKAACSLVARGYLCRVRVGIYRVTETGKAALAAGQIITSGPKDANALVLARTLTNGFRDRLWKSMHMRSTFSINDLVSDAVNGEADAINDAGRYIRILKAAGYVIDLPGRMQGTRPGSNGYKRFRLVKYTGPRAPLHRSKLQVLHDFNTGKDVECNLR